MGACSKFREDIVLLHIIMEILVGITCKQPVEGIGGTERLIVGELVVETNAYKATLRRVVSIAYIPGINVFYPHAESHRYPDACNANLQKCQTRNSERRPILSCGN